MDIETLTSFKVTNRNAKAYLEAKLYPMLRSALKSLLQEVTNNGELERYW